MCWFWAIIQSNRSENNFIGDKPDFKGLGWQQFQQGRVIENWNSDSSIQGTMPELNGETGDVLLAHIPGQIPVFSARLQEVIGKAGFSGIQFLPIHVLRADGTELPGFAVANILNTPPALDAAKTHTTHKVLKRDALHGYDIIRDREAKSAIYVSERFRSEFGAANCSGYIFKEVELS